MRIKISIDEVICLLHNKECGNKLSLYYKKKIQSQKKGLGSSYWSNFYHKTLITTLFPFMWEDTMQHVPTKVIFSKTLV